MAHYDNTQNFPQASIHHSFDIRLAALYGVEEAILIHHFQYWIRINRYKKTNIKEGRCWTYQTRKDIQAHFPYWNIDKVKYLCEKLVELGVMVTNNFNKSPMDKTLWYAFVNEKAFGVDEESLKNLYERQNCPSMGKSAPSMGKSAQPIPDTITDTKNTDKRERCKAPSSADAEDLARLLLEKIKSHHPNIKEPNISAWARDIDLMLRIDKRPKEKIEEAINCYDLNVWRKNNLLSASRLRKSFDAIMADIKYDFEAKIISRNKAFARDAKKKFPKEFRYLRETTTHVINDELGKDLSYSLPSCTFDDAFKHLFKFRKEE